MILLRARKAPLALMYFVISYVAQSLRGVVLGCLVDLGNISGGLTDGFTSLTPGPVTTTA